MRTIPFLALVLLVPTAAAHQALPEPVTGILEVPPSARLAWTVESLHPRDILNVRYEIASGPAVAAILRWTDSDGEAHDAAVRPASMADEFRFDAPESLAGATVVLENAGDAPATVTYAYLSSAPFWRSPELFLPAIAPFVFLLGAIAIASACAPWMRRRGAGPVRPPGWRER